MRRTLRPARSPGPDGTPSPTVVEALAHCERLVADWQMPADAVPVFGNSQPVRPAFHRRALAVLSLALWRLGYSWTELFLVVLGFGIAVFVVVWTLV